MNIPLKPERRCLVQKVTRSKNGGQFGSRYLYTLDIQTPPEKVFGP